ncbi:phosphopentomutase [uncultured Veillonella sp.]|uniref:phosphopentomutase n=1 Tax=uncultured Veillonella sp. TaxID=159268 RepID=UPI00261B4193|nr:phosphopentomutase [uncultured Veillonella sp.]
MFKRIILLVMDSVGIGSAPDASRFGDDGADTIGHIEAQGGSIHCPNLKRLGLGKIAHIESNEAEGITGLYGRLHEISQGKDTTSGHWELMGHPVDVPFPTFYEGFPKELMDAFTRETGFGFLGNEVASGTEIIERLGVDHMKTGKPIVYTSADSVFQIAAHEDIIPLKDLYRICEITRNKVCIGEYYVGRIIARPFIGEPGHFTRTSNRHDYSRMPEKTLYTELLQSKGLQTIGVGKIGDIYAQVGISESHPTKSNSHGMNEAARLLGGTFREGLMMINLVEFDSLYGHRRNVFGYKRAIEDFDYQLGGFLELLGPEDLLLITADHGNDPTWNGTDHTRELVPLLGYWQGLAKAIPLGDRKSFADVGQTILHNFGLKGDYGTSFLDYFTEQK